jgi:hypothetical protein
MKTKRAVCDIVTRQLSTRAISPAGVAAGVRVWWLIGTDKISDE